MTGCLTSKYKLVIVTYISWFSGLYLEDYFMYKAVTLAGGIREPLLTCSSYILNLLSTLSAVYMLFFFSHNCLSHWYFMYVYMYIVHLIIIPYFQKRKRVRVRCRRIAHSVNAP